MKTRKLEGICPFSMVASHYYPQSSVSAAVRSLRKYIDTHEDLRLALEQSGYTKKDRNMSPKQISILTNYLDPL